MHVGLHLFNLRLARKVHDLTGIVGQIKEFRRVSFVLVVGPSGTGNHEGPRRCPDCMVFQKDDAAFNVRRGRCAHEVGAPLPTSH